MLAEHRLLDHFLKRSLYGLEESDNEENEKDQESGEDIDEDEEEDIDDVVLHKQGVDANLRGEYLGLYDENERVELLGRRRVLRRGYVPRFPLEDYLELIRKPKKLALTLGANPIPAGFEKHCGVEGYDHFARRSHYTKSSHPSRWRCDQSIFITPPRNGMPPMCYVCKGDTQCWFQLGARMSEECIGAGVFMGFGPEEDFRVYGFRWG
jgi:hypothetical protein